MLQLSNYFKVTQPNISNYLRPNLFMHKTVRTKISVLNFEICCPKLFMKASMNQFEESCYRCHLGMLVANIEGFYRISIQIMAFL